MTKKIHNSFLIILLISVYTQINAATTLISPTINNGGFESGVTGWTFANDGNSKWYVNTFAKYAGNNGCYTDVNGTAGVGSNSYQAGNARVSHFYKNITFPAGEPSITLTFRWQANGEGSFFDWDNIKVFLAPTSVTPTAGTEVATTYQVGDVWYNLQTTWQLATITLPASAAGTTQRLIFSWKNDGSNKNDPGGAIDDVTIITDTTTTGSGCTSNTILYPSSTYDPTCGGSLETITSAGYATEYSMVNVISGQTYTFSTDVSTDYLTIANSVGGLPIYASGTTPVTWVSTITGPVRVYNNTNSSCGTNTSFRYRYVQCGTPPTPPANDNCLNATAFPIIPTDGTCSSLLNQTTAAATNSNVTPSGACTSNAGTPSNDVWFKFVATNSTIILNASWVSGVTDIYWQVFSGSCASTMTSILCTDNDDGAVLTGLAIGQTYYIRMYSYFGSTSVQNICLQTPPANDNCINAKAFPIIPTDGTCSSLTNQTTIGTTNSSVTPTGACTNNPGAANDDVWFSFVATASDLILNASYVSGEYDVYFQIFSGACGSTMNALLCTDNDAGSIMSGLTIGQTYYIRMYTYASGANYTTQNLCILNPCPNGTPVNDQPCSAINIPLGSIASGDNTCSFSSNEPAVPSCWTSGVRNTVWFSFTPTSSTAKIRTAPGTLRETQIAVYSGACGPSMSLLACNDNASDCGSTSLDISELSLTGLTPTTTYYIAVDGEDDSTGTFAITVVDGSASYPATSGQECVAPITVCNSTISVGDPGYQGIGFTCDQNNTSTTGPNCTTGERGAAWYKIIIDNPGTLYFNIVPNDYASSSFAGDETDYDFLLWKINGSGATTCAALNTNGGANTVACNYSYLGVTGLGSGGNAPAPYGSGYNDAYESGIAVAAGDIYLLAVQNYSNSTSGFTLDFTNTAAGVVNYGTPPSVTWSGGANTTSWTTVANWGGCTIPTCGINAIVSPSSSFQPRVTSAMGTVLVKNLTIDPGATLTLAPNSTIKICESLFNNGTIIADPTSTILFADDNVTHTLNGTLSGSSSLGNLLITDVTGSTNCTVTANTNLELKGNFTTSNANSIFNINGKNLTIAGNLTNAAGASTFTNTANTTITFNGTGTQIYSPNQSASTPILTLNNVVMNHTGAGVTISTVNTPDMVLGTSGNLTLNQGKIITPNSQEVVLTNTSGTSVTAGNSTSYIEGNLRRYLAANATGSFDFPVGHATPGYERANIQFTSAASTSALNLLARFDPWGGAWPLPAAPNWVECGVTYNSPYLNNGYWTINASAPTTGNYYTTLFNSGFSNAQSAWSIAKSPSASAAWALNGTCVLSTPVTAVQRSAMSGFSKFATIQYSILLPVELTSFTGTKQAENVLLKWTTASEKNSDYFLVEKSTDGINFTMIGKVIAAGNSNQPLNYSLIDEYPFLGKNYYRLKQIDKDGTYSYSQIVEVNFINVATSYIDNIHPNPANDNLYFDYYATAEDKLQIKLYDYLGRILVNNTKSVVAGKTSIRTDLSTLPKGVYVLQVFSFKSEVSITEKIIKE